MKRTAIVLISALILVIPAVAWAAQQEQISQDDPSVSIGVETAGKKNFIGEDFGLTVSLKIWRSSLRFELSDGQEVDDSAFMFGPAINLTYRGKFYTGMSYYRGSGYEYTLTSTIEDYDYKVDYETTKSDFDIWAGYSFHPRASAFIGYKYVNLDEDGSFQVTDSVVVNSEYAFKGPVIGITGNYPIGESNFILFGTLGYSFLKADFETTIKGYNNNNELVTQTSKSANDVKGPALEFGVSYIFQNIPKLSLTGGYKYQHYEGEDSSGDGINFSGLTFGANYRF